MKAKDVKKIFNENPDLARVSYGYFGLGEYASELRGYVRKRFREEGVSEEKINELTGSREDVEKNPSKIMEHFISSDVSQLKSNYREYKEETVAEYKKFGEGFNPQTGHIVSKEDYLWWDRKVSEVSEIVENSENAYLKYRSISEIPQGSKEDVEGFRKFLKNNQSNSLESKLLTSIFALFTIAGLIFSTNQLTGNVIGTSTSTLNFAWPGLALIGLVGLFVSRRYKK